ncbi:MAG: (deoxy)nucleoside triphosphate pyrophosphohydrolase [Bacilli bacterium]|nr:(deoxy)nucleoside triphosphate pyrophosphohydrolase [Bacilli bacterium]
MKSIEVVAAIIIKENEIFVTQRGYGDFKGMWEFPGGKIEPGETKEAALKREIKEELDASITVEKSLNTIEYDYPSFHLTMHNFVCSLDSDFSLLEHEDAKWVNKNQLKEVSFLPADLLILDDLIRF